MLTRVTIALVIAFASVSASFPVQASACSVQVGYRVVLIAQGADPDVFLWDSRARLIDYSAGHWGDTRTIFAHTLLAHPGTHAVVIACLPGAARVKYSSTVQDVVGVKVVRGPLRGRYGWVLSSDAHSSREIH
ncbi:MAG: hypothetical protein ABI346_00720 [Candidatus Baltobacteraceae bacterium]